MHMDNHRPIDDEQLIRFMLNEVTEQERESIRSWIDKDDQNAKRFKELQSFWRLLEVADNINKIETDREWNYFKRNIAAPHLQVVANSIISKERVYFSKGRDKKRLLRRLPIAVIAAASFLLIIFAGNHFFFDKGTWIKTSPKVNEERIVYAAVKIRREINRLSEPKKIRLDDGSEIILYENSEVAFEEEFPHKKRDIQLSGKADFSVAKDKIKPFTVYSGGVATTALGTRFTVTSYEKENKITVRLYEGRVVVKSSAESINKITNDFLLKPGNEFVYDKVKAKAVLRFFKIAKPSEGKTKWNRQRTTDNPPSPKDKPGTWFMFENQALDQVLDHLAVMFGRRIIYSKNDIHKLYFIGKFNKTESLESILKQVVTINELELIKKGEDFLIRKNE